jgi:hypothetical protein
LGGLGAGAPRLAAPLAAFMLSLLIAAPHPATAQNQVQVNQTFISQGPGPEQGNFN